jgi:myosin heavy subunit
MAGFGGAVKLTGESEYRKALKQIQTNLKEVSSEMKLVSAQYDKNDTSTEALKARSEALAKSLTTQKSALSTLQSQYTKLSSEQEKNKAKHDALVAEYEKEQAELQRIGEELGTSSDEYKAQAQVVANLAKDVDKSTSANQRNEQTLSSMRTEMNGLKTSIAGTESEMAKADDATDDLADSTKKAGDEARQAGDGFTVFKGVLSNLASSAITSALNGLKSLGTSMINVGKQAIASYADYEQLVGGVETLFGDSADVVQDYASQAYKSAGMSANEYMETVTSFSASLIQGLEGDTARASEYANRAITDMSDNANKMGTDIEMLQNAYNGFAKGNFTMLDNLKLGYGGTKEEMARLIADASKMTEVQEELGITVDESSMSFDNIVNAISVMQASMGVAGTTAKEASTTISGSLASAGSAWQNLLTGIADDNADFGQLIDDFVDSVLTVAQNLLPRIQQTITGLANMVSGLLERLVPEIIKTIPPLIQETLPILLQKKPQPINYQLNLVL